MHAKTARHHQHDAQNRHDLEPENGYSIGMKLRQLLSLIVLHLTNARSKELKREMQSLKRQHMALGVTMSKGLKPALVAAVLSVAQTACTERSTETPPEQKVAVQLPN